MEPSAGPARPRSVVEDDADLDGLVTAPDGYGLLAIGGIDESGLIPHVPVAPDRLNVHLRVGVVGVDFECDIDVVTSRGL